MDIKKIFKMVCAAWTVNAVLFLLAWFGGDILLHEGRQYLSGSIDAMRITLTFTKIVLSIAVAICLINIHED